MRSILSALTLALLCALQAGAQVPGAVNSPDPGVTAVRQIDRPDFTSRASSFSRERCVASIATTTFDFICLFPSAGSSS